jgi:predicted ATPase/DNA-binding winged helix-turn-helix (wHTH) protein
MHAGMHMVDQDPGPLPSSRLQLLPQGREVLVNGTAVQIGRRAFDILSVLVQARGKLVTKDEILSRVWCEAIVEENALQAQISALRKALGEHRKYIKTVPGRGYQFSGDATLVEGAKGAFSHAGPMSAEMGPRARSLTNLPAPTSELIGREADLREVQKLVSAHRLVTLAGPGGIGKTRLAQEAARHLLASFADGVWIAELAPLSDPDLVPATVATTLGLDVSQDALSTDDIAKELGAKRILLVLDNCEHVIDAAARMAEALLRSGSSVHVIATSREPLRAEAEFVYRVSSLALPADDTEDVDVFLQAGAVQLFVARARGAESHFSIDKHAGSTITAICRRLDGIPLAIELAAARAVALGLEGLAALDDRIGVLTGGWRTALPRHQTLRATLDWSFDLLPERERVVLRRISVFAGAFTLEGASAVAANAGIAAEDLVDCVANLVSKSLVTVDVSGSMAVYRLLKTTRSYVLQKLIESGEFEAVARHHAEYCRSVLERVEAAWKEQPAERLAVFSRHIDDTRAALDWAFSLGDEAPLGVALTIASVPLWLHLSLLEECRNRVERALASLDRNSAQGTRQEMQLCAALGAAAMYSKGPGLPSYAACTRTLEIAECLGDAEYQLRALQGLCVHGIRSGEIRVALELARRFCSLAARSTDPEDRLAGDRLIGTVLHYSGDQTQARRTIERMLSGPVVQAHVMRFQVDQRVIARSILARILWLQGFPDQALRAAQANVEQALAVGDAISVCYALAAAACPVALWVGDLPAAERSVSMLLECSERHALGAWNPWGWCFDGVLLVKRGDVLAGLQTIGSELDELCETRLIRSTLLAGHWAEALGHAGKIERGLAEIDRAVETCERNEERWCVAELLRVKGALLLRKGSPDAEAAAQERFRESLDWAGRQGALAWELRAATSLAGLLRAQGRPSQARDLLAPVYGRFTEGFASADLTAAKVLLEALSR